MEKIRYVVNVEDFNLLLEDAYKAIGQLNFRLETWKKHNEKNILVGLQGEETPDFKKKVKEKRNQFEKNYSSRRKEVDAIWDFIESGQVILQAIIDQKSEDYSAAYRNGFQAAMKQAARPYSEKMVSPKWEVEKYRAQSEFETIQKWPNLY
tara:strand:- start:74 stop:526 length:453 start_codon:yes stop_codon:yes gene_type:complete